MYSQENLETIFHSIFIVTEKKRIHFVRLIAVLGKEGKYAEATSKIALEEISKEVISHGAHKKCGMPQMTLSCPRRGKKHEKFNDG